MAKCWIGRKAVIASDIKIGIVEFTENTPIAFSSNAFRYYKIVAGLNGSGYSTLSEVSFYYGGAWHTPAVGSTTQISVQTSAYSYSNMFDGVLDQDGTQGSNIYATTSSTGIVFTVDFSYGVIVTKIRVAPQGVKYHVPSTMQISYTNTTADWQNASAASWVNVPTQYTGLTSSNYNAAGTYTEFVTGL